MTLTATDPDGLSVSLVGHFYYDWESQPTLEYARLRDPTPQPGDEEEGTADGTADGTDDGTDDETDDGGQGAGPRISSDPPVDAAAALGDTSTDDTSTDDTSTDDTSTSAATVEAVFDQDLRATPAPIPGQFTLNYTNPDGTTGTIAVTAVSISGKVLTLTLESAPQPDQTLTLDYTHNDDTPSNGPPPEATTSPASPANP